MDDAGNARTMFRAEPFHRLLDGCVVREIDADQRKIGLAAFLIKANDRIGIGERRRQRPAEVAGRSGKIGRASCRERVCQYVSISVVAGSYKKQNTKRQ